MQRRETSRSNGLLQREIISLAMDDNMEKELSIRAADDTLKMRKPAAVLIYHSTTESQYTSDYYKKFLGKNHVIQNMGNMDKSYDKA